MTVASAFRRCSAAVPGALEFPGDPQYVADLVAVIASLDCITGEVNH
ncbi:hypothetical protein [Haloterrigena salifodinae]|uniref:Uncharacterized protein n=1 Tax=Haloterrigena salifodinae TaxID=2675099 RepID=A0A8T8DWF5_9EURY|nr:hypothetical protein [Haloterrigena salifodinae]QRV13899.1 hypothetical protein JMJ58_13165 [Haloterrigena salifodinae]